ncbi:MAG: hypothetical protein CL928_12550 [Deltaproteobacteria bacterium]|nr:hypothetical protein [Deltaproteobacteria bacterium]
MLLDRGRTVMRWCLPIFVCTMLGLSATPAHAEREAEASNEEAQKPYTEPQLLVESSPRYPKALRDAGIEGDVLLQLSLDETGKPFGIEVLDSAHPELAQWAKKAARKLLFAPARIGVEAVPARLQYLYRFAADSPEVRRRVRKVKKSEEDEGTPVIAESVEVIAERPYRIFRPLREAVPEGIGVGSFQLGKRDIELAAGAVSDVAMAIHQLPSVSRQSFFRGSYSIRGSDERELITYLDGVPLMNGSVAGFLSRFNPNLIDRLTIHAGSQPARMAGAVGGITEIDYVAPDNTGFHGLADLGIINLSGQVSGPLGKKGAPASFVVSIRRSFLDAYIALLEALGLYEGLGFSYGDVYVRFHATPGPKRRHFLDCTFFWGDDTLKWKRGATPTKDVGHVAFGSVRARWTPSDRFEWRQQVWVIYETTRHLEWDAPFHTTHRLRPAVRTEVDLAMTEAAQFSGGAELQGIRIQEEGEFADYRRHPTWVEGAWASRAPAVSPISATGLFPELALYGELSWDRLGRLPLLGSVGVRWTPLNATGKQLVSPRASLALPFARGTTLKVHAGQTQQVPLDLGLYDPLYGPQSPSASKALTVSAAVEQSYSVGLSLRAEFYYRWLSDLLVWSDDPSQLGMPGSIDTSGRGFATGVDIVAGIRRPGWGVQASWSGLLSRRTNPLATLGPQTIQPHFVSPHQVKVSGDFQFGRRRNWTLAGNLHLSAPRPTSPMIHSLDPETGVWDSTPYNYNSLHLGWTNVASLRLEHRFVVKGRVKFSLYMELSNIRLERNVNVARARLPDEDPTDPVDRAIVPAVYDAAGVPMLPWVGIRAEL